MINKSNPIETIDKTNWTNQTKFRLDEISKIEDYFIKEINQRKSCSKKLSKYVAIFDYIDQDLIVLRATSCGLSIILLTSIVGAPVGIASASITSFFFSNNRNSKKIVEYIKKKQRKTMIKFLHWLKGNSVVLKH